MLPQDVPGEGWRDRQETLSAEPDNIAAAHLQKRLLVDTFQRELLDRPVQPDDHMLGGPLSGICLTK